MSMISGAGRRLAGAIYGRATLRSRSIRRAQARLGAVAKRGCRFLIVLPYLKSGGAERVAANMAHAFARLYGPESVAVLVTDWSDLMVRIAFPENTFNSYPPGVEITNIVGTSRAPYDERVWRLMTAVMSMRPELIINVNSELMWQCFERFAPELSKHMRLGTVAFANVDDKGGRPIGYPATHIERMLPYLDFVITDNQAYVESLASRLVGAPAVERVPTQREWAAAKLLLKGVDATKRETYDLAQYLSENGPFTRAEWTVAKTLARKTTSKLGPTAIAKFVCLYQYVSTPETFGEARSPPGRPQILWASRVSRAKFPEVLPMIARLLPDCDIHVHGAREFGYRFPKLKKMLIPYADLGERIDTASNLHWHGAYKTFGALPLPSYSAMLYTSIYDGLPNVLLEAGAYRMPIVAPLVGGIGELINEETGWPVANAYSARDYADRIREVMWAPKEAMRRANNLVSIISRRHSFDPFCSSVCAFVERDRVVETHPLAVAAE